MMKLFLGEQIKFYEEVSNNCCVDVNSLIIIACYNIIMCQIVDKLKLAIERYDESTNL